ncbi:hypothetical protein AAMO2058_000057300 [Amorphochlora amoebiformis]
MCPPDVPQSREDVNGIVMVVSSAKGLARLCVILSLFQTSGKVMRVHEGRTSVRGFPSRLSRRLRRATSSRKPPNTAVQSKRTAGAGTSDGVQALAAVPGEAWRDVESVEVSQSRDGFSVVISPRVSASREFLGKFLVANEDWLRELLHKNGAVMVRGFDVKTAADFNNVLPMQLGSDMKKGFIFDVIYKTIIASVFTLFKDLESLTLATRLSQRYIAFHCETKPEYRGETAIFDTHGAYKDLDDDLKQLLNSHYWRFRDVSGKFTSDLIPCVVNHEDESKPCIQVYAFGEMGETAAEVARKATNRDNLKPDPYLYGVTSFVLRSKESGEDREMSMDERRRLMEALYSNVELCAWQEGDVMLLDNISVAHGRMDGRGRRKINFCGICDYLLDINDYPRKKK